MLNLPENFILFDTEYTAWEGSASRRWGGPGEHMEIVQIGAIKVESKNLAETDSFSVFIKPDRNPNLSEYFISLTGITQDIIDKDGTDLESALSRFKAWCGDLPAYSYGRDESVLMKNCGLAKIPFPFSTGRFHDIRDIFKSYGIDTVKYQSGAILEAFGKKSPRKGHDALNDSRTILDGLVQLDRKIGS